ncbi:olfactory receptor 14J1-like, partial [Corapipo altera]|uniref:olfactory receptor 14J1-like n=1 Tax=Corapipo altera TaxID=415028 RepID=UPI000FD6549B
MSNSSSVAQFLLLALADRWELQLLHFCLFLAISLAALLANGLILSAVACDHHLHTPMGFFLLNLSLTDLGCICTTVPKAMHNSLWGTRDISYAGCTGQVFLFMFFMSSEYFLLTIMCYDRYVAICKPLHYGTLLGSRACAHMAAAAWTTGFLNALLHTASTFSLPLCQGGALGQFFCEIPHILKLSCSHSGYLREIGLLLFTASLALGCFVFIVFSYVQIFRAVLSIPSEQGRHKAFSTCLPHMAVVSLFLSTGTFAYLKPPSISSPSLDLALSVLYSVVPPTLNPLIYSLRNQELKDALRKMMTGCFSGVIKFLCSGGSAGPRRCRVPVQPGQSGGCASGNPGGECGSAVGAAAPGTEAGGSRCGGGAATPRRCRSAGSACRRRQCWEAGAGRLRGSAGQKRQRRQPRGSGGSGQTRPRSSAAASAALRGRRGGSGGSGRGLPLGAAPATKEDQGPPCSQLASLQFSRQLSTAGDGQIELNHNRSSWNPVAIGTLQGLLES